MFPAQVSFEVHAAPFADLPLADSWQTPLMQSLPESQVVPLQHANPGAPQQTPRVSHWNAGLQVAPLVHFGMHASDWSWISRRSQTYSEREHVSPNVGQLLKHIRVSPVESAGSLPHTDPLGQSPFT